jgi:RNA polymerase sigma-70 factor (ECF subfamily)
METPEDATVTQELVTSIAAGMEKLSPKHREVLILRNVKNLSYEEIAEILAISVGTVKSRIARARESLRAKLGGDFA